LRRPGAPNLISCTNPDNFTVVFGYSMPNPAQILQSIEGLGCNQRYRGAGRSFSENGNCNNWHQAIGTGPFILTDFVSGGSATMVRNHHYWAQTNAIRRTSFLMWLKLQGSRNTRRQRPL